MSRYTNNLSSIDILSTESNVASSGLSGAVIPANVNAAIISYFEELTGNKEAAQLLASSVIYTSSQQGIDPILMIQEFKSLPSNQLNSYLAAILNLNRVPTSLLGVQNQPKISKYVKRSIIP